MARKKSKKSKKPARKGVPFGVKAISVFLYLLVLVPLFYFGVIFNFLGSGEGLSLGWSGGFVLSSAFLLVAALFLSILSVFFLVFLATALWMGKLWSRTFVLLLSGIMLLVGATRLVNVTNKLFIDGVLDSAFFVAFPLFAVSALIALYLLKWESSKKHFLE
jgi:hypothetical protein